MKTTLELPDELIREVKIRAVESNKKLKDFVEESLRAALASPAPGSAPSDNPLRRLRETLIFHPDGTITNPLGIDDPAFFESLEEIRAASRREQPRDPFADD